MAHKVRYWVKLWLFAAAVAALLHPAASQIDPGIPCDNIIPDQINRYDLTSLSNVYVSCGSVGKSASDAVLQYGCIAIFRSHLHETCLFMFLVVH
jgi:hypothetical protein